jgi:ATP-dependent RNA helicase DeaD
MITFSDLGISADILEALAKKGFETPTPIQEKTIPLLLGGATDIIGQAQTGTGKTAAFGIPILEKIQPGKRKIQAIVLTPTRELAMQVCEEIVSLKGKRNIFVLPVYGGQGMDYQLDRLRSGVDIVVGTPGRVIDHLERGTMNLDNVEFIVLDEADEMLNMGFVEEIEKILTHAPEKRQMLLFSATMPYRIQQLAEKYMGHYEMVRIEKKQMSATSVEQIYYEVYSEDKLEALCRIIDTEKEFYALIFCKTKNGTDELANQLIEKGYDVEALHGDVSQHQRERVMKKFKAQHSTILVATDVAARGIDVNNLTHVINYDIPGDSETYVHRVGRTGRAGKEGKAITFVSRSDLRRLQQVMQIIKTEIKKGKIPSVQEAIQHKIAKVVEEVKNTIAEGRLEDFQALNAQLLENTDTETLIAALIKRAFGKQLDLDNYKEIRDPGEDYAKRGASRLRRDGVSTSSWGDRDRGGIRKPSTSWGDRDRDRDFSKKGSFGKSSYGEKDGNSRFGGDKDRPFREREKSSSFDRPRTSGGRNETLFFARGAKDGLTVDKLVQFITKEASIDAKKINEIKISGAFSLFSIPSADVDKVISTFKTPPGKKPLVRRDRRD